MRKRESVNRNEKGKDGKKSEGNGEMGILNCKGKMEAKNRKLIKRRVIKKIMKKRKGRAQKTDWRMGPQEKGKSGRQQKERMRRWGTLGHGNGNKG